MNGHGQILSQRGDKFQTDLLVWDEKKEKVYSDNFIQIEQDDKIIKGYGFESNQDLTEYEIKNTTGVFTVEDTAPTATTQPQDSLRNDSPQNR